MKIRVKLFATLRNHHDKDSLIEVDEGATPEAVALMLNLPMDDIAIVMINGVRSKLDSKLSDGDTLSMFPAVGGG